MKTKSNLLNYISHLMHNDDALHKFSIDPITTSEKEHGLTKAERAVLRRTIQGLSNNSVNGYSLQRNLDSYRRSLRLLQNVLCNVGSKMVMDTIEETKGKFTFGVQVFCPIVTKTSDEDFTCKKNNDVDKFGGAYRASTRIYTVTSDKSNPTIKEILDATGIPYGTVHNKEGQGFVSSFALGSVNITADISNDCYNLDKHHKADSVFWFYSINGRANPGNSGSFGKSFADVTLTPNDTVFWQLIAPDSTYGFKHCEPHEDNAYAKTMSQKA